MLVLLGVGPLDVADRTLDALHVGGDAFVALAAHAGGPLHRGAGADLRLQVRADFRQVVGEQEGGARAVGAVHDGDVVGRQLHARVQRGDRLRVPLGDLAQVDVGQHRRRSASAGPGSRPPG